MRVAAFTDHLSTPSSRFRIRQYFPFLSERGIAVRDFYRKLSTETAGDPGGERRIRESRLLMAKAALHESANLGFRFLESCSSNLFDAVWLSRQLVIGYPTFEPLLRKPLVYDVDDAIFLAGRGARLQFEQVVRRAEAVVAGNDLLAGEASRFNRKVFLLPTAVDTGRWRPAVCDRHAGACERKEFMIGWSGTSSSFGYLATLQDELARFLGDHPAARLAIMSDRFPHELSRLAPQVHFRQWSEEHEVAFVQSLDVGLMPVADDAYARGKCSYKMLLYAACAVPVVVSPVGNNKSVLEEDEIGFGPQKPSEWYEALAALIADASLRRRLGDNGVNLVKRRYSLQVCAPLLELILRDAV